MSLEQISCPFAQNNVFHQTTFDCCVFRVDGGNNVTHVYNRVGYSQTPDGRIYNLDSIKNGTVKFERLLNDMEGKLIHSNFDMFNYATCYSIFNENLQNLQAAYGHDSEQMINRLQTEVVEEWRSLLEQIIKMNLQYQQIIDGTQHALTPKKGFDVYISLDDNTIYFMQPIELVECDVKFFDQWRAVLISFFRTIGECVQSNGVKVTAAKVKNMKKCSLLDAHFHEKNHLRGLKCTIRGKNLSISCEEACWRKYRDEFIQNTYAHTYGSNHKCLIDDACYIGYSLMYRNHKFHTLLCTPIHLLDINWYNEINMSLINIA